MKMIRAIIRPECESEVALALERAGCGALTKWDVLGRGRQQGIQVGGAVYGELPKISLMVVVSDENAAKAVDAILKAARTGHPGDGRIFVSDVKTSYTIRTGTVDQQNANI